MEVIIVRRNDNEPIIRLGNYPAIFERTNVDNPLIRRDNGDNLPFERLSCS